MRKAEKEKFLTTFLESWEALQKALVATQAAKKVNDLKMLVTHSECRREISRQWRAIEMELRTLKEASAALPPLPPLEQIHWAQTVSAMPGLLFLEVDTTGLETSDEVIRCTLVDRDGEVFDDRLIQPRGRTLSTAVCAANGISSEQLETSWKLEEVWSALQG